jgi:hypothetical protein
MVQASSLDLLEVSLRDELVPVIVSSITTLQYISEGFDVPVRLKSFPGSVSAKLAAIGVLVHDARVIQVGEDRWSEP